MQDELEADAVFAELEQMVIPMFYDRSSDGLPRSWIAKMRRSMKEVGQRFSAQRMVAEYHRMYYEPALEQAQRLRAGGYRGAVELAHYLARLERHWGGIAVERLTTCSPSTLRVGDRIDVTAWVRLAGLDPAAVEVALYHGALAGGGEGEDTIAAGESTVMKLVEQSGEVATYRAQAVCRSSGRLRATVRVMPVHAALPHQFVPGLFLQG